MNVIIEKFKPLEFSKAELNINELNKRTKKKWIYASSGKVALYHCLISLNVKGTVLIPTYVCDTILKPITELGLSSICYDLNIEDLNVDLVDLEYKLKNNEVSCVLIASMYGNPASMSKIESLCKDLGVLLIDDAAQSFESKCDGRYIGTFGDAGFFSFSPGKATPGHLGAFFWTKSENYTIERKNHFFIHLISYWDFYFNRYRIYQYKKFKVFFLLTFLKVVLFKLFDLHNDDINSFEKRIMGGILKVNKEQTFRHVFLKELKKNIDLKLSVRLVTFGKKDANNHKIVLLCVSEEIKNKARVFLEKKRVYSTNGYELLNKGIDCPNAQSIVSRIIEIPLEDNLVKNEYITKLINKIFE